MPLSRRAQTSLSTDFLGGKATNLYVWPDSHAAAQAVSWQTSDPAGAAIMRRLANIPQASWFSDQTNDQIQSAVDSYVGLSAATGAVPTIVAYHIVNRDGGGASSGGATSVSDYQAWVNNFALGIGNRSCVVILEPDALSQLNAIGLSTQQQQDRIGMINYAITRLKSQPRTFVYVDAGNPLSQPVSNISNWLTQAGVAQADGFSLNVSNFFYTADNVTYGTAISRQIGGKHFVIDTSRNGNGPTSDYQWANPSGRAFGPLPTIYPRVSWLVDALLWIKIPGESDGPYNGGPTSGVWWPEYAVDLATNAGW